MSWRSQPYCSSTMAAALDSSSLLQLLPELLNGGGAAVVPSAAEAGWVPGQDRSSDQDQFSSDCEERSSQSSSEPRADRPLTDVECDKMRDSPKRVDLDEIEKFLDGITNPNRKQRSDASLDKNVSERDMAAILREVDELGRRTLSASSVTCGSGRPPPSPRRRQEPPKAGAAVAAATASFSRPAASESALLGDTSRRVHFSRQELRGGNTTLARSGGDAGQLSLSEPAIGAAAVHGLLSEEKRKTLNLTADMILLKQSSLENEIHLKTEWEDQMDSLIQENASLKAQVDGLQAAAAAGQHQSPPPQSDRVHVLERRLQEQDRILDGFNAENARLYRQLKQVKIRSRALT